MNTHGKKGSGGEMAEAKVEEWNMAKREGGRKRGGMGVVWKKGHKRE